MALFTSIVVFSAVPSVDIAVSSLFYRNGGFIGVESTTLETIRQAIWDLTVALCFAALFGALIAVIRDRLLGSSYHVWNIVVGIYLLGPGLVVNGVLKAHWGRARPADIHEFGGLAEFTPALWPSDECARNCSFASGEASGAVAFAIGIWLLTEPLPQVWLRRTFRALTICVAGVGSTLRLISGRHFLSDVVFAALIVTGLALFLLRYKKSTSERDPIAPL